MESKFFSFIKPYLVFIDTGNLYRKPFKWLYYLIALLNLILPFYLLYQAIKIGTFRVSTGFTVVFILIWLVIVLVSWVSFQLWWDRAEKVADLQIEGKEFIATPVFSHFIQTFGEWLGTWIGIVGFALALFGTLFLGGRGRYLARSMNVPFIGAGIFSIILMPVIGFLIIVGFRFFAEQVRALASIANNTKRE